MWLYNKIYALVALVLVLSGCGFKPLYSKHEASGICKFKNIILDSSNDAASIAIRRHIENYISACEKNITEKSPISRMLISATSQEIGALYLKTGEATRKMIKLHADVQLFDENMSQVHTISVDNYDSYNSINSPFSEYVASQNSLGNAANGLANQIIIKLNRYSIK
ncbi:MAG: hypothetical protein J0G32_02945 [Alphaproteobacteria bacterium]|nr:hypothetical protein [Alphaproteobacteria bacterium]OJV15337.1 MAG: hypothetical protein BGO27_02390 [Alphaproteobacteria bacterium 33-17]